MPDVNKKILTGGAAVGIGIAVLGVILMSVDWEARAVHKRLDGLVSLIEKRGSENPIMTAGKARRVLEFFAEEPEIRLSDLERRIRDRGELQGAVFALRSNADTIGIRISQRDLVLRPAENLAELRFRARVSLSRDGHSESGEDWVRTRWLRQNGDWKLDQIVMESETLGFQN